MANNKLVAETDAVFVSRQSLPLLGTVEFTRFWPRVIDQKSREAVKHLDDFTSNNNTQKRFYVVDPLTDGGKVKHPGTWRCAGNRLNAPGEAEGVYQVLRLGFATTLADDETRLRYISGNPQTKNLVVVQYWPNLDPEYTAPLANTLNATTTVTNPRHHLTKSLTGTFAASQVRGEITEDGSGMVSRILSQVTAVTKADDLDSLGKLVVFDKQALHLFALQAGDTAASEGTGYSLAVTWTNIANTAAVRDVCCAVGATDPITDAQLVAKVERIPDVGTNVGWAFVDRKWNEQADGTATLTALFRRVDNDNTWTDAVKVSVANLSGYAAQELWRAEQIPTAGVIAKFLAVATADLSATQQGVTSAALSEQGENAWAISQSRQKFYTGTTSADAVVLSIKPGMGGAQTPAIVRVWWRRTKAAMTTLTTETTGAARINATISTPIHTAPGILYTHADCDITDHGDGAYTVRQILVYTGVSNVYFNNTWIETAVRTRASDDKKRTITYHRTYKAFSSEEIAYAAIDNETNLVAGSVSVVQRSRFMFVARWTTMNPASDITNWT